MVTAVIVINQAGKPPGSPGVSRDDLDLGVSVTLTNNDNTGAVSWFWEFVSKPLGSAAAISGSALPSASFVPDVRGSYLIKLTVDESPSNPVTDTRIAAVKTAFLGIRKPATSEKKEFDSVDGWSAAQQAMIDGIDADAALNLKRNGSNQPTANINWGARLITNLGGLENEGALRLGEISNPAAVSDKGFLYAKDDSGDTELFYMDDGGSVVQITKDGRLNVDALQGDALPATIANGFLKRNSGNTTWEEVPYGTTSNTVCQGNDARLSDSRTPIGAASGQLGGSYPGPDVRGVRETSGPTLLTIGAILDGQVLVRAGSALIGSSTAGGSGGKVKIRVDDAADGYLHAKLLTGNGLKFAIGNPGGNETLTLDAYGEAKVSSADTTFGYLLDKLVAGSGIGLSKQNGGGNENILISATGTGGKVKVRIDDLSDGYLHEKLLTGSGLKFTIGNPGGAETLTLDAYGEAKVSSADTTFGYLFDKLAAGTNITITKLNPGGNESIQIASVGGNTLGQSYNQGGAGAGRVITANAGAVEINASGGKALKLDGYLALTEISAPASAADRGFVFAKDDSGNTELCYRDDKAHTVQITKGGLLNASAISADSYQAKVSSGDTTPNYLQSKLAAGNNIVLTKNGAGGNETLTVATQQVLKLDEQGSDPTQFANDGYLYSKDVSGLTELFYRDSDGNILQISKAGRLNLADGYISFRYDELSPTGTTGSETSLSLAGVPVEAQALHVFRNGMLMRHVNALGSSRQEYTLSGATIGFQPSGSSGDWYSALYIDGYMMRGAGGTVKQNVALTNNQGTDSATDTVVGSFPIAAGDYSSQTIKFLATAFVTSGSLTGHVKLYNVTDSALVSDLVFSSVTTTKQISSALALPSAEKMYEVRITVTGGSGPTDRIACMWAGLQIG